jgi:hypothetical protein
LIFWSVVRILEDPFQPSNSMKNPRFDRLANWRRNRRLRNITAAIAGIAFFTALLLGLDPVVSGEPFRLQPVIVFGLVFFIAASVALYYHMRFLTRE